MKLRSVKARGWIERRSILNSPQPRESKLLLKPNRAIRGQVFTQISKALWERLESPVWSQLFLQLKAGGRR